MPWKPKDAKRHSKKADTPKKQRQWAGMANSGLEQGHDEGTAIRLANAAIRQAEINISKGKRSGQGTGSIRKPSAIRKKK